MYYALMSIDMREAYVVRNSLLGAMVNFAEGELALPIRKILWAPTNAAHGDHLHVEGPHVSGTLAQCTSKWTEAITTIRGALDGHFGEGDHWMVDDDSLGWTHMGVYNCRNIAGTNTPSQHAFSNAIDIGPYYGKAQQQKFYDFLTRKKEDEMVSRNDKADDGLDSLKANYDAMVKAGIFSEYTQPGGVTFNDEFATFLIRFESYLLNKIGEQSTTDAHARSLARKALDKLAAIKNAI